MVSNTLRPRVVAGVPANCEPVPRVKTGVFLKPKVMRDEAAEEVPELKEEVADLLLKFWTKGLAKSGVVQSEDYGNE